MDVFQAITNEGIAPVVSIRDAQKAVPLARAIMAGGISSIEITLRTNAALEAISNIRKALPEMTVSAGTVLDSCMADEAASSGAQYVVSPGYNERLVEYCKQRCLPIIPGCSSASEIAYAVNAGLYLLKFFPAEQQGGLKAIELLSGPFKNVRFLPTGGLNWDNIRQYLMSPAIAACGGSFMARQTLVDNSSWEEITADCRRAMDISLGFNLAHVGINCGDENASETAGRICNIFRMSPRVTSKSVFAGSAAECMSTVSYGKNGHVGMYTNSAQRAQAYFNKIGVAVDEASKGYDKSSGRLKYFYIDEEIGGFRFHVVEH